MKNSYAVPNCHVLGSEISYRTEKTDNEISQYSVSIYSLSMMPDQGIASCLGGLIGNATEHLKQVNDQIRRPYFEVHAALLRSVAGVRQRVNASDFQVARMTLSELAEWFAQLFQPSVRPWPLGF